MNEATVQTILNYVITFLSTGVGATILGLVVKSIVTAIANVKSKKYSKLTESDKASIVSEVTQGVLNAIQDGVSVDMDAQLDKATARRITAVEKSQNEIVQAMQTLAEYNKVVLSAIGDFKTISQASKEQIQAILKGKSVKLETVQTTDIPILEVKQPSETDTAVKTSRVSY